MSKAEIENISHDLRTPLTYILGYMELINDENISDNEKNEYLSIIERRAKGLNSLVQAFKYAKSHFKVWLTPIFLVLVYMDKMIINWTRVSYYNEFTSIWF